MTILILSMIVFGLGAVAVLLRDDESCWPE